MRGGTSNECYPTSTCMLAESSTIVGGRDTNGHRPGADVVFAVVTTGSKDFLICVDARPPFPTVEVKVRQPMLARG